MTFIFKEIAPHSPFLSNIKALYESAFPPDERRDFAQVEQLLAQNPHLQLSTYLMDYKMYYNICIKHLYQYDLLFLPFQ